MQICLQCHLRSSLCMCNVITPIDTALHVLILQHPQEPGEEQGTARMAHLALPNSTLKVGLSWPNLTRALGHEATPSRWAVLYLGSGVKGKNTSGVLQFVSKKSEPVAQPDDLDGIVILDGTWSQAKALWWRNAWLLKLKRCVLSPHTPSLYGKTRKEPRRECLSTIESIGQALVALGEPDKTNEKLTNLFAEFLQKLRTKITHRQ